MGGRQDGRPGTGRGRVCLSATGMQEEAGARGLARGGATRRGRAALLASRPRCAAGGLDKALDKCNEALEKLEKLKSNRQGSGAAEPELNIYLGNPRSEEDAGRESGWRAKVCARGQKFRNSPESRPRRRLHQTAR